MSGNEKVEDVAEKALIELGLSERETSAYLSITGRGPVSIGEIAIHGQLKEEEAKIVVNKLINRLGC